MRTIRTVKIFYLAWNCGRHRVLRFGGVRVGVANFS